MLTSLRLRMKRRLSSAWSRVRSVRLRVWVWQLVEWAGAGAFTYGFYLVHPAAGYIVGGLLVMMLAIVASPPRPRRAQQRS